MGNDNTALTIREQHLASLEQSVTQIVAGKILHDQVEELIEEGDALAIELRAIDVTDQETCDLASDTMQRRLGWAKRVEERIGPYRTSAHQVHQKFSQLINTVLAVGSAEHAATKTHRDAYLDEKERQKRADDAAAAEATRKLDNEARADAAREARALGASPQAVQQIMEQHTDLPPASSAPVATAGSYKRENWVWSFEGTPEATLIKLVQLASGVLNLKDAKGKPIKPPAVDLRYLGFLAVNTQAINAECKKKSLAHCPSVRFYDDAKRVDRAK